MSSQALTRRAFIKAAGVTAAGVALAGVGLGVAATRTPTFDYPEIVLEGETSMKKRILVAYATRAGSTAEIAQAIAETLTARGYAVDVRPVKEKPSLDGCAAVVLGSAVRMGAWLPEATCARVSVTAVTAQTVRIVASALRRTRRRAASTAASLTSTMGPNHRATTAWWGNRNSTRTCRERRQASGEVLEPKVEAAKMAMGRSRAADATATSAAVRRRPSRSRMRRKAPRRVDALRR
jgi:hypothetical protein